MFTPSRSLLRHLRRVSKHDLNKANAVDGRSLKCAAVAFSTTCTARSGHSKWATIKHDKARADAKKNKQRSILAQQIELMSKLGGPDPASNPRLKTVVADAKRQGLPKEVLEGAIKRGQGLSTSGKPLETVIIEAMFPGGVAAIIECSTESKAKTLMEARTILTKNGGKEGVVGFLFKRRGVVRVKIGGREEGKDVVTFDEIMETALEVEGFEDAEEKEEGAIVELYSEASAVKAVADAVEDLKGAEVQSMEILWQAEDTLDVSDDDDATVVANCFEKLEEMTEVQNIYHNMRED